ncbi:Uridylate kinase [Erysiphe neolycopersici]|uniref:Uridylate kinase n=1 Tax=Erysiphe neolycopersici TaxID=212602 RepID=A0A420I390_9PEZI|nr:Uridylate kinase [Erysiphe neolycopersici]
MIIHHHISHFSRSPNPRMICQVILKSRRSNDASHLSRSSILHSALAQRNYGSGPNPNPTQNPIKIWPFVAITLLGSGAYALMVKSRTEMSTSSKSKTTFSPSKVSVVFVLGGPGAGKGTQCARLVRDYQFIHLSAGDLLRAEQDRKGSEFGHLIKTHIKEGKIVPMEVTIKLLEKSMIDAVRKSLDGNVKFLIDGFPRKMDQALNFEETLCQARFVLFFDCSEEEMQRRLLKRGETSGRTDDNPESIKKRFRTFIETSMPVIEYYKAQEKVVTIDATKSPEEVYEETKYKLKERLNI